MKELKCPICGEPTSVWYGNARKDKLCRHHAQMLKDGELAQCEDCGEWYVIADGCKCKKKDSKAEKQTKELTCLICGENSNGKPQCKNCYNETKGFMDTLNKNSNVRKFRDYYYNLKDRLFIIKGIEETKRYCNKLIAIAMMNQNVNDDSSLMDKVYKDVENLIKSKKPTEIKSEEIKQEQKESDEKKIRINTADDGHNVDSDMEVIIDNILYNSSILHCYGKNIDEITEKRKKCDWFVPITGTGKRQGIYIEYWGREDKDYEAKRKEKEELYKIHNVPYISIEKDDPKKDTQTFKFNLIRELTELAVERFGFMPEWHKVKE